MFPGFLKSLMPSRKDREAFNSSVNIIVASIPLLIITYLIVGALFKGSLLASLSESLFEDIILVAEKVHPEGKINLILGSNPKISLVNLIEIIMLFIALGVYFISSEV